MKAQRQQTPMAAADALANLFPICMECLPFFYPFGSAIEEMLQQAVTIRSVLRVSKTVEALQYE
jgi:hypothetical protein